MHTNTLFTQGNSSLIINMLQTPNFLSTRSWEFVDRRNDTFIRRIILGKGYIPPFMRGKKAKNTGLRAYTASTPNAEYLIVL